MAFNRLVPILALAILLTLSLVFPRVLATGIDMDVKKGSHVIIETELKNSEESQNLVYIVQIEHTGGFVEFISIQNDTLARNDHHSIGVSWSPEREGAYEVKTFVISSLENPILLSELVQQTRISIDGQAVASCSGSADCFVGTVTKIVDGDTLDVGDIRIRLALVNTPETNEAGYAEAKQFTSSLCPVGARVLVDEDDGQLEGSYGRMIAKVTCDDKILNAELLKNDHAEILSEFCDVSEFASEEWVKDYGCSTEEQIQATNGVPIADAGSSQTVNEGTTVILDGSKSSDPEGNDISYTWKQTDGPLVTLKDANTATPSFTAPSVSSQATLVFSLTVSDGKLTSMDSVNVIIKDVPTATSPPADEEKNCDPSYPTVCIPPPPPDLDCGDISYRNFKVLQPDPHRFDGDKDGIGCET